MLFYRSYGEKLTVIDQPFELTADQCWNIVQHKELDIVHEGQRVFFKVNPNGQTDLVCTFENSKTLLLHNQDTN